MRVLNVFAALAVLLLCACASVNMTPSSGYDGWLPFIENIDAPQQVTAGEDARITLTLSAQQQPELLSPQSRRAHVIETRIEGNFMRQHYDVAISPGADGSTGWGWPNQPESAGNTVVFTARFPESGTYQLVLRSAAAREDGGAQIRVATTPSPGVFSQTIAFAETAVPITVVAAP